MDDEVFRALRILAMDEAKSNKNEQSMFCSKKNRKKFMLHGESVRPSIHRNVNFYFQETQKPRDSDSVFGEHPLASSPKDS